MQAALMTFLTAVQSGAETTGDTAAVGSRAAGQGMRINSALQSRTNETLFTTILQKGISIETMLGLSPGDK
ncbi:MAG: hypothetical protein GX847_10330, partial [Clostridiales bacterium]|nr:hypothetical protein [Clostridiales bacterium]